MRFEFRGDLFRGGHTRFVRRLDRANADFVRRERDRPNDPGVVPTRFDQTGDDAADADPVAAHNNRLLRQGVVEEFRVQRFGVFRPKFKDVADFDRVLHRHRSAATRASVARERVANVAVNVDRRVAVEVDVGQVFLGFVRADNDVDQLFNRRVGDDLDLFFQADRARETDRSAGNALDRRVVGQLDLFGAENAAEFVFVDVAIAANQDRDRRAVDVVNQRFNDALRFRLQERANLVDRVRAGGVQLRDFLQHRVFRTDVNRFADFRFFDVRRVTAGRAVHDVVFAVRGRNHKLVRRVAADRAGLRFDRQIREAATFENAAVSVVHILVRFVQRLNIRVEAVRVLHQEFARAQKAELRTLFVAELRLDLVKRHRELTIARDVLRNDARDFLFVRRAEDDRRFRAAAGQRRFNEDVAKRFDAVRLFVKRLRAERRHKQLGSAGSVHFFANDVRRLVERAPPEGQERVGARHHLRNHPGAEHQNMTRNLRSVRRFLHRRNQRFRPFHRHRTFSFSASPRLGRGYSTAERVIWVI